MASARKRIGGITKAIRSAWTQTEERPAWADRSGGVGEQVEKANRDAAQEAEAVRVRRLREDAQRPISVNLAETIALSHELIKMADATRRG